jgi:hypothetical protein
MFKSYPILWITPLVIVVLCPASLWAWGEAGHKAVAILAEERLDPTAKEAVAELLGPGKDLASISTWADWIVQDQPETGPWHYINLDVRRGVTRMEVPDRCARHGCVVDQIEKNIGILRSRLAFKFQKRRALKFLVHFVGDLHQPLHCADDKDRGGNEKWLRYRTGQGRRFVWVNLHSHWDGLLGSKEEASSLAARLSRGIRAQDEQGWIQGKAADWAYESYEAAKNEIYQELPEGPLREKNRWGMDLPRSYYSGKMKDISELQLRKAGVRLAWILNGIFEK